MNPQQFVLWLSAYMEGMGGRKPTQKDWDTFKAKLSQVEGAVIIPPSPQFEINQRGL